MIDDSDFIFAQSLRGKKCFCWCHTNTLGTFLRRFPLGQSTWQIPRLKGRFLNWFISKVTLESLNLLFPSRALSSWQLWWWDEVIFQNTKCSFNWPSPFSVPKRKSAFSKPELRFHEILYKREFDLVARSLQLWSISLSVFSWKILICVKS